MGNGIRKEGYNAGREAFDEPGGDQGVLQITDRHRGAAAASGSPPETPRRFRWPFMFSSQSPVAPLKRGNATAGDVPELALSNPDTAENLRPEKGIPTLITWSHGGNDVSVEGSWDNWASRKPLQKCGKDHSILFVLPCGVYHYKFFVDGEWKHIPDLPFFADNKENYMNVLDVQDFVPDSLDSVSEFEPPMSPDSSYGHLLPAKEDLAKEPPAAPPQLDLDVPGPPDAADAAGKPRHVALNHLVVENGWGARSVVALGTTERFRSKYVTVVLYKPTKKR